MSRDDDADLERMARLIDGDDSALDELMRRWQKPLLSFILRYVGNEIDSVEIAQEAFVRVYHNRHRFNFKSKFSTWLFTIGVNLCRNHARWRDRHPTIPLESVQQTDKHSQQDFAVSREETPSHLIERSELARQVREAIEELPHELKTAVLLHEYENLSYDEIGKVLGCTQKAVETRLYRARKLLRKKLAEIYLTDKDAE
ncbi:MAG TPA: sigma-70 family RNA polymerase sigma factor [Chthoniobacterales bacterium]|nr:sigma-70 family RNA polymerase sigma factor [Chthoniobacterales bacterium]